MAVAANFTMDTDGTRSYDRPQKRDQSKNQMTGITEPGETLHHLMIILPTLPLYDRQRPLGAAAPRRSEWRRPILKNSACALKSQRCESSMDSAGLSEPDLGNDTAQIYGTTSSRERTSELNQFLSNEDSDDSVQDPDYSLSNTSESEKEEENDNRKDKQLTRWRRSHPSDWKRNIAKKRRSDGLNYEINKKQRPPKKPRAVNCEKCRFKCQTKFSDAEREAICSLYWRMNNFERQKDFLLSNITSIPPERRRQRNGNKGPRSNSKQYYFEKDRNKMRICQAFFLKTLNISGDVVKNAFQNKGPAGTYIGEDKRGKSVPGNKTAPELVAAVKEHIESFPTVRSHYSRKTTKEDYLDSKLSISKMYSLYKEKCESEEKQFVTFITYKRIFGEHYNLSFFKPKKDLCQICERHKTAENEANNNEIYESHVMRKKDCYIAKNKDKVRATNDESFVSSTFDLQSVLQIPCSDVSPMYYSRKICVYNLTIYNSAPPNDAYCYCW
ncbi:unnamed protein product [Phaedon cochleariae]|uniref:Uncharacterized protein n=1 Tax=Phaedon cochleariae TaxID=80249 RepID=A0A9N9SJP0_PHACE|nr:unnamed protein product [Phaedon cochleariae]